MFIDLTFIICSICLVLSKSDEGFNITLLKETSLETYSKLIPCFFKSHYAKATSTWRFPDDGEEHYKDLLNKTQRFRGIPMHDYGKYAGPWIENHFINRFINKPLSYFRGIIPIFVQFVDLHVYEFNVPEELKEEMPTVKEAIESLLQWLRDDVIYLIVSQDDQGVTNQIISKKPNVLVLSAGGYGHVPIPLIKGELNYSEPKPFNGYRTDVGFYGNPRPALSRSKMLREIEPIVRSHHMSYVSTQSNDWIRLISETKYNLAPRGFGRTSFRYAEVIHIGRIPIYIYDDVPWLPYRGTNMSLIQFGLSGQFGRLSQLVSHLEKIREPEYIQLIDMVKNMRYYYTYEGVMEQIELFLQDPFGINGGYLRCERVPDKEHRRLTFNESLVFGLLD